jgi:hypothetical protein
MKELIMGNNIRIQVSDRLYNRILEINKKRKLLDKPDIDMRPFEHKIYEADLREPTAKETIIE